MKKQGIKKFGLLALAMMLLTGCYNGWDSQGSRSSILPPSSSEPSSSEEPEPEPVVFDGVDLTYEFDEGPFNPVSEEKFQQILEKTMGDPNAYQSVSEHIHPYLLNYFLTHNHLTDEELAKTFPLINTISSLTTTEQGSYGDMYNLVYYFASINTDHFLATFREVWEDQLARAYFISLFKYHDMSGYNGLNDYLGESDAEIRELARKESLLREGTPEFYNSSIIAYRWFNLIEVENIEVAFRFLRRLARVMVINLSEKEIGYVMAKITKVQLIDIEDITEEIMENLLDLIHRCGNTLTMFNINAKTWEAIYPVAMEFVENSISNYDMEAPLDAKHQSRVKSFFNNFFKTLNPRGLRVLINFIGTYAEHFTQEMLEALQTDPDDYVGSEPIYQCLVDLYNELYGLLDNQDKEDVTEAFNNFGINLDQLVEELKEACSDPDVDGDTIEEIVTRLISEKVQRKFQPDDPESRANPELDTALILKQGTEYTITDFTKYLREFRQWSLRYKDRDNWCYEVNQRDRNNIKLTGSFDTSTTGLKFITFSVETSFTNYGPESVKLIMPYYVVSSELDILTPTIDFTYYYKDTYIDKGWYAYENGQPIATSLHNAVVLLKDHAYRDEDNRIEFEIHDFYMYNTTYKMFVKYTGYGLPTGGNAGEIEPVAFSTLDVSEVGLHYATTTLTVKHGEDVVTTLPVYFKYKVVEKLPTFDHNDPTTPIK